MANVGKVKPWVKYTGLVVLIVAVVLLGKYGLQKAGILGGDSNSSSSLFSGSSDADITLGVNTYAGFLPFMYLNGGLEPNENSILYKNYGIKLKIVIQDDFAAGRQAFKNGDIDIIYCTADALPVEMGESGDMTDARFFNISNWSRGADAIVVNKSVQTVQDLKGKIVACSEGTASNTLLLNTLETSGITSDQVNYSDKVDPGKVNIKKVASGVDAANVFRANQCDAAVCFSPDDQDLVQKVPGSKVLISTKQASNIICDGLIAKQSYLEKNKDKVVKLISALLWANSLMNTDKAAVEQAAKAFASSFGTEPEFAISGSKNIRYVTLADEANFMGLNSGYTGMKGEELYSKMARTYSELNLVKSPLSWNKVCDTSIIEALLSDKSQVKGDQSAESGQTFSTPTESDTKSEAISNKKVTINFPTGSDVLDGNAQATIDREFAGIAKEFGNARVRIEGNTDGTGSDAVNIPLSQRRAQSVANYLVKNYGFNKNRFIVVGNGSKHAIADGVIGENADYRTTDFMLIN